MTYRHFGDYLSSLQQYDTRRALTIRPFLKIQHVSYKELREQSARTSHFLTSLGLKKGDRLMVIASNSPEWVELLLGSQLLGVIVVPVDSASSPDTVENYIRITQPKAVFKNKYLHHQLEAKLPCHALEDLDHLNQSFVTTPEPVTLSGEETALIVFTSGTTADPKGVALSQRNILSNVSGVQAALTIDPDWRVLSVLPLSHMYEVTGGCLSVLSKGASIYYMPRVTPLAIAQTLELYQITTILAIPQLLVLFLERINQAAEREGKAALLRILTSCAVILPLSARHALFHAVHKPLGGHLHLVVTGGAPIPPAVEMAWGRMGVKVLQGYGLTETAPILTVNRLTKQRLGSAGLPLDNVELRVGSDDEIQAKGPNVFTTYWHNPTATKAVFTKDGWFRTGDTGHFDKGWLFIQGRLKFAVVLSSGLKVFPEDIEKVAASFSELPSLCIVGVKRADGDEAVQAVLISNLTDEEIDAVIAKLNGRLEAFQHIGLWRRWPETDFPRTRLLKVDRRKVQQWAQTEALPTNNMQMAGQQTNQVQTMIRLSLNDHKVTLRDADHLADIGLDSLRRLNLIALIEEHLGISLDESLVLPETTVAGLRELIASVKPMQPSHPIPDWQFTTIVRCLGNFMRDVVLYGIVRIWVTMKVEGRENVKNLSEPALFIFNHTDDFDAPVVCQAVPRRIRKKLTVAMADDVMHTHKILAFIARFCFGAFNFSRKEPYLPSLEYVCRMLDRGWHVLLSPEGRIRNQAGLQHFKSGIGLLAVNSGAPVILVKTIGLQGTVPLHAKWPKKHSHVTVKISNPIRFSSTMDFDEATRQLYEAMKAL